MLPAQQGFGPDRLAVAGIKFGLVVQAELVMFQRLPQVLQQLQLFARVGVHRHVKEAVAVFTATFGVVHRGVSVHQQFFGALAIAGVQRNTDARRDLQVMLIHPKALGQQADLAGGHLRCVVGPGQTHQQHKFIAANARQGVLAAQLLAQTQGHFTQQAVAHVMAKRIVDRFEAVQVDKHQRKAAALLRDLGHGLADPVSQQDAVRQPGQGVMQGQLGEFFVGQGQ